MRNITLFLAYFILINIANAQSNPYCASDKRFTDAPVFTDDEIDSDVGVSYGHATDYKGQDQNLILNVYYPRFSLDTFSLRPLIVLVHGGGFSGGSLNGLNKDCIEFARRGYVAATVEYRLGWHRASSPCDGDPMSMLQAFYRSLQDVHAAIRYLVANAAEYRIDTHWIFAGGSSAGAFTTVNLAFLQQAEIDAEYPVLRDSLGLINGSGNLLTDTFRLKGLFNNWGGVFNINNVNTSDAIPVIGFVGDHDPVIPIDTGYWQGCTNFPKMWGSRGLYDRLTALGMCAELNVKEGGGHGVWDDTPAQDAFRIGRASCFFKSLFCNSCTTVANQDSIPAACSPIADNNTETPVRALDVLVYPNPFSSELHVATSEIDNMNFTLMNSVGQSVWTGENINNTDFSALPAGIYFLKMNTDNGDKTERLIKW